MLQRKNLATITKPLIITKDNKSYSVRNLDEGLLLLRQWHILESLEQRQHDRNHSDEMTTWQASTPPGLRASPGTPARALFLWVA